MGRTNGEARGAGMTEFVWTIVLIIGVESLCKVAKLAQGETYSVTLVTMAVDVVIGVGLVIWGATLLCQ